jgi:hypothetical protein
MAPPDPKPESRKTLGRALTGLFAFGVFGAGYMAMRTNDWRQMLLWTVIAAGCAWFASRFSAWSR